VEVYNANVAYLALSKIFCMITILLKKYYGWHILIWRKDANSIKARKTLTQFQETKQVFGISFEAGSSSSLEMS